MPTFSRHQDYFFLLVFFFWMFFWFFFLVFLALQKKATTMSHFDGGKNEKNPTNLFLSGNQDEKEGETVNTNRL